MAQHNPVPSQTDTLQMDILRLSNATLRQADRNALACMVNTVALLRAAVRVVDRLYRREGCWVDEAWVMGHDDLFSVINVRLSNALLGWAEPQIDWFLHPVTIAETDLSAVIVQAISDRLPMAIDAEHQEHQLALSDVRLLLCAAEDWTSITSDQVTRDFVKSTRKRLSA